MSNIKRKKMKEVDDIARKIYDKEDIEWSQALKKAWDIYKKSDKKETRKRYSKKTNSQRKRDRSTERKRRSIERKKIKEKEDKINKRSPQNKRSNNRKRSNEKKKIKD